MSLSLAFFFACCGSYNILCSFHWAIGISNVLFAVKFFLAFLMTLDSIVP